ncbi:hypothetical protein GGR50DRAFT_331303 [Xylaria sp. CBS 124048]|nr:hypothetical protein GGR50DRAFT_331303 [Xylaria sp. CBS 124048]
MPQQSPSSSRATRRSATHAAAHITRLHAETAVPVAVAPAEPAAPAEAATSRPIAPTTPTSRGAPAALEEAVTKTDISVGGTPFNLRAPLDQTPPVLSSQRPRRRPARGALREEPCMACLKSAIAGRSSGECHDAVSNSGYRCWRCASGGRCQPIPEPLRRPGLEFVHMLQQDPPLPRKVIAAARNEIRVAIKRYYEFEGQATPAMSLAMPSRLATPVPLPETPSSSPPPSLLHHIIALTFVLFLAWLASALGFDHK